MTAEERADVIVTGRLLRAAANLQWLTIGLTIASAGIFAFPSGNRIAAAVSIVIGLIANVYAFRVAFDARLFEDVAAERLSTSDLDSTLWRVFGKDNAGRNWSDRCRGARRLVGLAAIMTTVQTLATIGAGLS